MNGNVQFPLVFQEISVSLSIHGRSKKQKKKESIRPIDWHTPQIMTFGGASWFVLCIFYEIAFRWVYWRNASG